MKIYIGASILIAFFIGIFIEFYKKNEFYTFLSNNFEDLEEKYLIAELLRKPTFVEGKILKSVLEVSNKSMIENVNKYKFLMNDYKEYIELWIHEIKIPIATSKMIIQNNKNSVTRNIDEELDKVEGYIEQALFYARSNITNKDYFIRKYNLVKIINECIKKNKNIIIQDKISLELHDLELDVFTDNKWTIFILTQVINNCIKYMKEEKNKKIEIFARQNAQNVVLYIVDNGIGIEEGEISRVFDKGFTGTNGRIKNRKSTGIGLYLCKKLCNKLGMGIEISSEKDVGTEVRIVFPKSSYTDL